ncbi:epimerase [Algoriphagus aestuariicola]|uniref:Epimerase n=1 Tax=Algoriphagus aestuariicola TaxID=1852016 RepID=A0ABS3BUJ5_9BACT|nr:epimerase [Algoriphagus aestuariicola]MBN7802747.1 epimerase [Algoriphagus aestuariicola]
MNSVSIIGLGWIGTPTAHLLRNAYEVIGSTTNAEKQTKLALEGIKAYRFSLNPHPEGIGFNTLFHSEILIVNIPPRTRTGDGTFHLEQIKYLKSLLAQSTVKKVLFVSSTGVYPDQNIAGKYAEDFPVTLDTTGHDTIFRAEQMMAKDRNYDLTIVRFGGLLGDDRIPLRYFTGKENVAGHTRVNFIHRQDAARMLAWIVEKGLWNGIYNGVAPKHPLRRDIYEKLSQETGMAPPASYQNEPEGNDRLISSEKIRATGFEFKFSDPLEFSYQPQGQ